MLTNMETKEMKDLQESIKSYREKGEKLGGTKLRAMVNLFQDKWRYCEHTKMCTWPNISHVPDTMLFNVYNIEHRDGTVEEYRIPMVTLEVDGQKDSRDIVSLAIFEAVKCLVVSETALAIVIGSGNIVILKLKKIKAEGSISVIKKEIQLDAGVQDSLAKQLGQFLETVSCTLYDMLNEERENQIPRLRKLIEAGKKSVVQWKEGRATEPSVFHSCFFLQGGAWWEKHVSKLPAEPQPEPATTQGTVSDEVEDMALSPHNVKTPDAQ
jgi:hypothetical protein